MSIYGWNLQCWQKPLSSARWLLHVLQHSQALTHITKCAAQRNYEKLSKILQEKVSIWGRGSCEGPDWRCSTALTSEIGGESSLVVLSWCLGQVDNKKSGFGREIKAQYFLVLSGTLTWVMAKCRTCNGLLANAEIPWRLKIAAFWNSRQTTLLIYDLFFLV